MTSERLIRLASWWVRLYTRGLPDQVAARRAQEIDADLHDHVAFARQHDTGDRRIAVQILSRMLRGAIADLTWRRSQARREAPRRPVGGRIGRTTNRTAVAGAAVLVVAVVLGSTFVMSGLLLAPVRTGPHPAAIAIWLAFGGGVTALGRIMPRSAALGAAGLLAVVAIVDLALPLLNVVGSGDVGWISTSQYTWLAIAVLAVHGLVPARRGHREDEPAADPST